MGDPSVSRTFLYREKTAIPGPMAACARSTGAMLPFCKLRRACGRSFLRDERKSLRVVIGASSARGRHARTIEEARAFVPRPTFRVLNSDLNGHVPVTDRKSTRLNSSHLGISYA